MTQRFSDVREVDRRKLNVIEGLILAAMLGVAASNLLLRDSVVKLQAQNEALQEQVRGLTGQVAVVSALSTRVATLEVKEEAHAEALKELRQVKGLR